MRSFHYCNGYFCSITREYRQIAHNKITHYIEQICNALEPHRRVPYPTIDEPEDLLPEEEFDLNWSDFVIGQPHERQAAHLKQLHIL